MHRRVALCQIIWVLCLCSTSSAAADQMAESNVEQYNTTSDGSDHSSMAMYFHVSPHATILFKSWHTMTFPELYGSAFAVFLMAIAYEALKAFRQYLIKKYQTPRPSHTPKNGVSPAASITLNTNGDHKSTTTLSLSIHDTASHTKQLHPLLQWQHIVQALLHLVQVFLGMCLMLVYMTFNVALCVGVTLGEAVGYYLFAWIPMPMSPATSASMDEGCH